MCANPTSRLGDMGERGLIAASSNLLRGFAPVPTWIFTMLGWMRTLTDGVPDINMPFCHTQTDRQTRLQTLNNTYSEPAQTTRKPPTKVSSGQKGPITGWKGPLVVKGPIAGWKGPMGSERAHHGMKGPHWQRKGPSRDERAPLVVKGPIAGWKGPTGSERAHRAMKGPHG